jgi:hypothetical protein
MGSNRNRMTSQTAFPGGYRVFIARFDREMRSGGHGQESDAPVQRLERRPRRAICAAMKHGLAANVPFSGIRSP